MPRRILIPASLTLCTALTSVAYAADSADPFAIQSLSEGYLVADNSAPGAGKSAKKPADVADGDSSDANKNIKKKPKNAESKCGEVKCGSNGR